MSLSTSSFKNELKVVALIALCLLACELVIRAREDSLSLDLKHIRQLPQIAKGLSEGQGTKILFLGNSLTRNGVDVGVLDDELKSRGVAPFHIERAFPDGTSIADWQYVLKNQFVDAQRLPNVLIICFATALLQDNQRPQLTQMAHYYAGRADVPQILRNDIKDFDDQVSFMIAYFSSSYANRQRVEKRVLDAVIPHYRESAQRVNDAMLAANAATATKAAPQIKAEKTYERLKGLIAMARHNDVRVLFVAMPQREPYGIDPKLIETINSNGAQLIDCRIVPGLDSTNFLDPLHLNPAGAVVFTNYLAPRLADALPLSNNQSQSLAK